MARLRWLGAVLVVGAIGGVMGASLNEGPKAVNADVPASITPEQIALRVEHVLRGASYLHVIGKVTEGEHSPIFESHMTASQYRTDVFESGQLVHAQSWTGGRVREYRPRMEWRPLLERDTREPDGATAAVFGTDVDCLVGTSMSTWVGDNANHPEYRRRQLSMASRKADARIGDRACFVLSNSFPLGEATEGRSNMVVHTFYVDQERYLVLRWETDKWGVLRIRKYQIEIGNEAPTGIKWSVESGDENSCKAPVVQLN